jgi:hypothetical protein
MDDNGITRMYKDRAHWLHLDINALSEQFMILSERLESVLRDNAALRDQSDKIQRRVDELTDQSSLGVREIPAFVKPNVKDGRRRKPGRAVGHEIALRRRPDKIDVHQEVVSLDVANCGIASHAGGDIQSTPTLHESCRFVCVEARRPPACHPPVAF